MHTKLHIIRAAKCYIKQSLAARQKNDSQYLTAHYTNRSTCEQHNETHLRQAHSNLKKNVNKYIIICSFHSHTFTKKILSHYNVQRYHLNKLKIHSLIMRYQAHQTGIHNGHTQNIISLLLSKQS